MIDAGISQVYSFFKKQKKKDIYYGTCFFLYYVEMAQGRNNFANYSEAMRGRIVGLTEQGLSAREVAQQVGCNIKTVELWRRKFCELGPDGLKDHRKHNRRPKKTTPEQDAQILNIVQENPFRAAEHVIPEIDVDISKRTVIRRLKAAGLVSCRPTKKCVLNEGHRQERLAFANRHLNKPQEEWDKWIWSDEKVNSSSRFFPNFMFISFNIYIE